MMHVSGESFRVGVNTLFGQSLVEFRPYDKTSRERTFKQRIKLLGSISIIRDHVQ